jgi:hypothetical protein
LGWAARAQQDLHTPIGCLVLHVSPGHQELLRTPAHRLELGRIHIVPAHQPLLDGIRPALTLGEKIRAFYGRAVEAVRHPGELGTEFRQGALDQFYGIQRAVTNEIGNLPAYPSTDLVAPSASV